MKRFLFVAAALGAGIFLFVSVNEKQRENIDIPLPQKIASAPAGQDVRSQAVSVSPENGAHPEADLEEGGEPKFQPPAPANAVRAPDVLAKTIYTSRHDAEQSAVVNDALHGLSMMAREGSRQAIHELAALVEAVDDDNRLQHRILQNLGQLDDTEARGALLDALGRKLDSPVETIRVASYLRPDSSGYLPQETVKTLSGMLTSKALPQESFQAILAVIRNKGGPFGHEVVAGITRPAIPAH